MTSMHVVAWIWAALFLVSLLIVELAERPHVRLNAKRPLSTAMPVRTAGLFLAGSLLVLLGIAFGVTTIFAH